MRVGRRLGLFDGRMEGIGSIVPCLAGLWPWFIIQLYGLNIRPPSFNLFGLHRFDVSCPYNLANLDRSKTGLI